MSPLTTQNMHVYGPVTPTMIKESEKQSILKALIKAGGGGGYRTVFLPTGLSLS